MRTAFPFTLILALSFFGFRSHAQIEWPKVIPIKNGGTVTIYQPQPESLDGNKIKGHSAIAARETSKSDPVYGAIFYIAYISTDKANRTASLDSIQITDVKISGLDDQEKLSQLVTLLETEIPKWNMEISLDALVATIKNNPSAELYNNDPPRIYYRTKPTSLVILDGEPIIKKDKDLDAERVLNTPFLIFREDDQWNMYNGGIWYKSDSVTTGWSVETTLSAKVKSINEQIKKQEKENNDSDEVLEEPKVTDILVTTIPAELLQSNGECIYKDIDSTSLSYVSNSSDNIFRDNSNQKIYVLLAGRWYSSSSLQGPWTFNESDKLPADFSKIPEGSEKDGVLVSVSGTPAAMEAIMESEIPQTAKVDRKTATVKVEYDGTPKFSTIAGTALLLAENSNLTVLKEEVSGKCFALDNGVWFTSTSSAGPWSVAITRPVDVEKIPPQCSAYNARFVYIYEVAEDYTIQGYTGGYLGSYVQGDPVIIFGTGFYYRPWYGAFYYPAPLTWGFGFAYNPWIGWGMCCGYNVGYMHVGFSFGYGYGYGYGWGGGWYGPPMYRPPYYRPPYGGGYYGHGHHPGHHNGHDRVTHHGNNQYNGNRNNLYNNNKAGVSTRDRPMTSNSDSKTKNNTKSPNAGGNTKPGVGTSNRPTASPGKGSNDIFADKNGNVFQHNQNGVVNQRDNASNSWKSGASQPAHAGTSPNGPTRPSTQPSNNINRDIQMRDRSNMRTSNYQSSGYRGSAGGGSRPSGGGSRGGGRGRG